MMATGRLLMVDDSPTVRRLVELTFARSAWEVDYATCGGQAVEIACREPPDVVLLDFVLPDMRGVEVCELLAKDEKTRHIPIVVMSGKGAKVAELFHKHAAFHTAIGKPSSPDEIRTAVESAFASRVRPPETPVTAGSFQQREATAKIIYGLLREPLAQIPNWMAELGSQAPAAYFARKLLSPELVGRILGAVASHGQASRGTVRPPAAGEFPDASLQGSLRGWSVAGLITFLEASARTGELTLVINAETNLLYIRAGEVILVTNREPSRYLRAALPTAARRAVVSREAMEAAEVEQRASGTPVFVTMAASGHFPLADLTEVLRGIGRRLLLDVVDATDVKFAFRDLAVLPAYVEAHGRHVSFARNTQVFGSENGQGAESVSEQQWALVRLRRSPASTTPSADQIFIRETGFSTKIQSLDLTTSERRVLALLDGSSNAGHIALRSGLPYEEALATLGRLAEIQLLRGVRTANTNKQSSARPLMILEPDLDGFQAPLATLLGSRTIPVRLLDLSGEADVVAAVQREQPQAVLLNASVPSSLDAARRVRASAKLSDIVLVAVVDPQMTDRTSELLAAGFDSTLVKPIVFSDIERLLQQ